MESPRGYPKGVPQGDPPGVRWDIPQGIPYIILGTLPLPGEIVSTGMSREDLPVGPPSGIRKGNPSGEPTWEISIRSPRGGLPRCGGGGVFARLRTRLVDLLFVGTPPVLLLLPSWL